MNNFQLDRRLRRLEEKVGVSENNDLTRINRNLTSAVWQWGKDGLTTPSIDKLNIKGCILTIRQEIEDLGLDQPEKILILPPYVGRNHLILSDFLVSGENSEEIIQSLNLRYSERRTGHILFTLSSKPYNDFLKRIKQKLANEVSESGIPTTGNLARKKFIQLVDVGYDSFDFSVKRVLFQ